jgi:hypothetical protein
MDTIKITLKSALNYNANLDSLLYDKAGMVNGKMSLALPIKDKLSFACNKLRENLKDALEVYEKRSTEIHQEYCSVDKDNCFFLDEKGNILYNKITREKAKDREAAFKNMLNEEIDLELFKCTDLSRVKKLDLSYILLYKNILFDISDNELEDLYCDDQSN